jgi:hypothetical protein
MTINKLPEDFVAKILVIISPYQAAFSRFQPLTKIGGNLWKAIILEI